MMPEEWPIAAVAADGDAPARAAGGGRLATVRADFFLDPAGRLTEQERALMTAMLHCLVGDIADEMRAALPVGWAAANDEDNARLTQALTRSRLLDDSALMALLLRRADEDRIATAVRARSGRRDARVVQGLVSHQNSAVSAAAMALILARGRRRDRFGQCLVSFDDLARGTAEKLVYAIAAVLRREVTATRSEGETDLELTKAAARLLASREGERSLEALMAELVRLLDESGALTDDLMLAAAQEGEAAFLATTLGWRAGIPADLAMDELQSGEPKRVTALLRMSGLGRQPCAGLLASLGDLLGLNDPGEAMSVFDRMSEEQVSAARLWLSTAGA